MCCSVAGCGVACVGACVCIASSAAVLTDWVCGVDDACVCVAIGSVSLPSGTVKLLDADNACDCFSALMRNCRSRCCCRLLYSSNDIDFGFGRTMDGSDTVVLIAWDECCADFRPRSWFLVMKRSALGPRCANWIFVDPAMTLRFAGVRFRCSLVFGNRSGPLDAPTTDCNLCLACGRKFLDSRTVDCGLEFAVCNKASTSTSSRFTLRTSVSILWLFWQRLLVWFRC